MSKTNKNNGMIMSRRRAIQAGAAAGGGLILGVNPAMADDHEDSYWDHLYEVTEESRWNTNLIPWDLDQGFLAMTPHYNLYAMHNYYRAQPVEELEASTADTAHWSLYSNAEIWREEAMARMEEMQGMVNQTEQIATSVAKVQAYNALAEDKSQSEAVSDAHEEINKYYAGLEETVWQAQIRPVQQVRLYIQQIVEFDALDFDDVFYLDQDTADAGPAGAMSFHQTTIEGLDGREVDIDALTGHHDNYDYHFGLTYFDGSEEYYQDDLYTRGPLLIMHPDDGDDDPVRILDPGVYESMIDEIYTSHSEAQDTISQIVSDLYDEYGGTDFEVSPVMSASDRGAATMGSYSEFGGRSAYLANAYEHGLSVSPGQEDIYIDYDPHDEEGTQELAGSIATAADDLKDTTLEVGDTYDTDNLDGFVEILSIKDSGEVEPVVLDGTFEVIDMTDPDGESMDSVEVSGNPISTADMSDLQDRIEELIEQRETQDDDIEEETGDDPYDDGGGGLFGDSLPIWAQVGGAGAIAYGAYKVLFEEDDGGGGRGGSGRNGRWA